MSIRRSIPARAGEPPDDAAVIEARAYAAHCWMPVGIGQTGYVIWRLDWPGVWAALGMAGLLPIDRDTLDGLMRLAERASEELNSRSAPP